MNYLPPLMLQDIIHYQYQKNFPNNLEITAETDCGEIMAIQHKKLPVYGVQFHPESIMSEHGHKLLKILQKLWKVFMTEIKINLF